MRANLFWQNIAGGGLVNEPIGVFAKQIAFADRLFRRGSHSRNVRFLSGVAFLERRARISGRLPLGLGLGEWDVASRKLTHLSLEESARHNIPAQISSQRRLV